MNFIKIRKPLKYFVETPQLNEVLKHTKTPQKFYGNASKKETPKQNKVLKVFFSKNGNASKETKTPKKRENTSTK